MVVMAAPPGSPLPNVISRICPRVFEGTIRGYHTTLYHAVRRLQNATQLKNQNGMSACRCLHGAGRKHLWGLQAELTPYTFAYYCRLHGCLRFAVQGNIDSILGLKQ